MTTQTPPELDEHVLGHHDRREIGLRLQDVPIDVVRKLEEQLWVIRSQFASG